MKNSLIKVVIISIITLLVGSVYTTKSRADMLETFKASYWTPYTDFREILKEENTKSIEDLTWELTYKAQKEHKERIETERINHEKFVAVLKKEKSKKSVSRGTSNKEYRTFEATYYTAFCDTCSGTGKTASGVSVANSIYYKGYRVIASNQNEIPMWSIVEIKTHYGTFKAVALDTGGFGDGGIDVLVGSTKEAYSLGRHDVQVKIIGNIK